MAESEVKPMSEVENLNEYLKNTNKKGATKDEWVVGLLSSIAHSLAVIADKIGEGEKEEQK